MDQDDDDSFPVGICEILDLIHHFIPIRVRVRVRVRVRGGGFTSSESDTECVDTSSYCPCRLGCIILGGFRYRVERLAWA